MKITDIQIRKLLPRGNLLAAASFVIDDTLAIHDIKIIKGDRGLFIAMPSVKCADGSFRDLVHPTNNKLRRELERQIIAKYQECVAECEHG
ncbi:putative septation protein SpoVG [Clostridia bacterium]|nr:putative septation protein SpoVG [Clostridia bacterium]